MDLLISKGYTSISLVALHGASAGGLPVASVLNRCADLVPLIKGGRLVPAGRLHRLSMLLLALLQATWLSFGGGAASSIREPPQPCH